MDKGMKSILVALGILCLVSIAASVRFFLVERATYNAYVKMERQLRAENAELTEDLSGIKEELSRSNQEKGRLKDRLTSINEELRGLDRERDTLKKRNDALLGERDDLTRELRTLTRAKTALEERVKEMGSDKFFASLLRKKTSLEVEVRNLKEEIGVKGALDLRLKELTKAKLEVEKLLENELEVAKRLSRGFLNERNEKIAALENLERIKRRNEDLEKRLTEASRAKSSLEKKLAMTNEELERLKAERDDLAGRIEETNRVLRERLAELDRVRQALAKTTSQIEKVGAIELPPIIVRAEGRLSNSTVHERMTRAVEKGRELAASIHGRIVTVNREYDFVVIDLGEEDGLKTGMSFSVYRANKEIGEIEVIDLRRRVAACDILKVRKGARIKPEDLVIGSGP